MSLIMLYWEIWNKLIQPACYLFHIEYIFLLWVYWSFEGETGLYEFLIFTKGVWLNDERNSRLSTD